MSLRGGRNCQIFLKKVEEIAKSLLIDSSHICKQTFLSQLITKNISYIYLSLILYILMSLFLYNIVFEI